MNALDARIRHASWALLLLLLSPCVYGASENAKAKVNREVFATADDGTPLHWLVFAPPGEGRHPAVLVIHGGGFKGGGPPARGAVTDLAAAGFVVFSIEYRLCPPGHLEGQKSAGLYPDQTNDVRLAARAARKDPRSNGQVGGVGGSAGGTHVAMLALTGTPGDDQLDVGVCLSGAYDFSDTESLKVAIFKRNIGNYVGSTDPAKLLAASPIAYVNPSAPPLFLIQANKEDMPPQQLPALATKLMAAGVTRFQQQLTVPGELHGFAAWPQVKEPVLAFLKMGFAPAAGPTSEKVVAAGR